MDKTRAELEEFRKRRIKEQSNVRKDQEVSSSSAEAYSARHKGPSRPWLASLYSFLDTADPLNILPLRLWREQFDRNPVCVLIWSLVVYSSLQAFFIWCEFGAVFFVFAMFVVISLGLGRRSDNEASAYSVFNPNCERLLGSMTSEHFERDMLHRQR